MRLQTRLTALLRRPSPRHPPKWSRYALELFQRLRHWPKPFDVNRRTRDRATAGASESNAARGYLNTAPASRRASVSPSRTP